MEAGPDGGSAVASVALLEHEAFVGGAYVPAERHFTDERGDTRMPGPDSELHIGAGWTWTGAWSKEDWQAIDNGRQRLWRREKSRAPEWVILDPGLSGASSPPTPGTAPPPPPAAAGAVAADGASAWGRLYSTIRTISTNLLLPTAADKQPPVNVARFRAVVALARLLVADASLLPFGEMIEATRGAGVAAAAEALKTFVIGHWLEKGETAEVAGKAKALLRALGRVAQTVDKESEEYGALMNAMQPLVYLCGGAGGAEEGDEQRDERRTFVVTDAAGVAVEMTLYEDVLVKGASEVTPLDWLWIAFQKEKQVAKLITLSSSFAFSTQSDVLDLLRGSVARWLSKIGAIGAGHNLRQLRYWCADFVYRGSAKGGAFEGLGVLVLAHKDIVYSGRFEQGKRSGKGMQVNRSDGITYKGSWANDKYDGRGVLHFSREFGGDAFKFIGHFKAGHRDGMGVLYRSDGSSLRCVWRGDAPVSPATLFSAAGTVYSGGWSHNAPNGFGVESLAAGRYYGEWSGGLRHGRGVFEKYASRASFGGVWAAGAMAGKGTIEVPGVMSLQGMLHGSSDTGDVAVTAGRVVVSGTAATASAPPYWGWFVKARFDAALLEPARAVEVAAREAEVTASLGSVESLQRLLHCESYVGVMEEFVFICSSQLDRKVGPAGVAKSHRDYLLFVEALRHHLTHRLVATGELMKNAALREALEAHAELAIERALLLPAFYKTLFESCEQMETDVAVDASCAFFAKLSPEARAGLLGAPAELFVVGGAEEEGSASGVLRRLSKLCTPHDKLAAVESWIAAMGSSLGERGLDDLLPMCICSMALACVPALATERVFVETLMSARDRELVRTSGMLGYAWATFCSSVAFCESLTARKGAAPPQLLNVELEDTDSHLMMNNSFHREITPPPPGHYGGMARVESADYMHEDNK